MNTANGAVRQMWLWHKARKSGVKGFCLRTVRQAWELPGDEPSAIQEWNSIDERLKDRRWWTAPAGAPHFWAVGAHGHIAIQSHVKGWVWSTDAPIDDRVGKVPLRWFKRHWGAQYLGWSKQLQNRRLPL